MAHHIKLNEPRKIIMLGMRQRGKKPVAILILWLIWWIWRDTSADTVLQQIDYALSFIAFTIWLAVLIWFIDSAKSTGLTQATPPSNETVEKLEVSTVSENQLTKGDEWQ